ncbi:Glyco_hydro_17 domain-containing protein [Cephalotus follicularis]|uniref:glucan endo-1,3-beta-D-glucosidase n=1 Tax=Cephalotus follicularis TaxID=3775 RepID=A0A1Q3BXU3_CEPFO|nr:Glyco_hydro_17 domain-containing protein [Cephalotus follicularis]
MGSRWTFNWVMFLGFLSSCVYGVGVNWGALATHKLPQKTVVQMLKDNGITRMKLFDADENTLSALAGSNIEVMVAIPNYRLKEMNNYNSAKEWVGSNIARYNFMGGVTIKYVAVGNEPFFGPFNGTYKNVTFPALRNIQNALNEAGVGDSIKVTVPLNADVYSTPQNNPVPSAGRFRRDIRGIMTQIVRFLNKSNAPLTINIYPFLSLYGSVTFPKKYAFFDGGFSITDNGIKYTNAFDANFDTLVSSLKAVGFGDLPIIVGETGWPTDGDKNANIGDAYRYYKGLLPRLAGN